MQVDLHGLSVEAPPRLAPQHGVPHSYRPGLRDTSEGGMMRLETLIELNFFNSSFLSLSSY